MKLFVLRHGDAGDNTQQPGEEDPNNPLTPEGREVVEAMAKHMRDDLDLKPTLVYSSPFTRTRQTAEIVRKTFGLPALRIEDGLGPGKGNHRGATLAPVVKRIIGDPDMKRVVVVAHHDTIAHGLSALNFAEPHEIDPFAKSELRILDIDRETGMWDEVHCCTPADIGFENEY